MVKRTDAYSIAVLFVLGLTPLTWFSGDYSAVGGYDFATSLKPIDDLMRSLYLWDERLYAGAPNVLSIGTMPYFLLQFLFERAAGSLYRGQAIFFTLLFILPGLSMYWFLRRLFAKEDGSTQIAFIGALFAMFNTFVVVKWNRGELITLFCYGTLPLYLALVDRGFKGPLSPAFMLAYIASLFFYPVSLGHPADFVIAAAVIAAYGLWLAFSEDRAVRLKRALVLVLTAIGTGLWWALPVSSVIGGDGGGGVTSFTANEIEMVNYYSSWATLLNLMKMWFFSMYATGVEFSNQFYRPGSLLFPIMGFSALLFRRNPAVLFFCFSAIAGLWLSKGTLPPFSGLYEWMYRNVPFFYIFRAPTRYFPLVYAISLSVLIGFSLGKMSHYFMEWFKGRAVRIVPAAVAMLLIFFHSWPLFKRDVIFRTAEDDLLYPSVFLKIPPYYGELNDWFTSKKDYFRVHSLHSESYMNYDWGYSSTDIATKLLVAPQTVKFSQELIFGGNGFHSVLDEFTSRFWAWDFGRPDKLLGLFSVRYVTVINDVMRRYLPETNFYETLESAIPAQPGFSLAAAIGDAKVYENSFSRPHIYASGPALAALGDRGGLVALSGTEISDDRVFVFIDRLDRGLLSGARGSVNGLVFVESSFYDALLDSIDKKWLVGAGDTEFIVDEDGLYSVWVKKGRASGAGLEVSVDGKGHKAGKAGETGLRWINSGEGFLEEGVHSIKAGAGIESAAVVPVEAFEASKEGLVDFLNANERPVSYVFTDNGPVWLYSPRPLEARSRPLQKAGRKRVIGSSEFYDGADGIWVSDGWEKDASAIMRLSALDIEEFPYARLYGGAKGELHLRLGVDFDNDGWADDEVASVLHKGEGDFYDSVNLAEVMKEEFGFPGKPFYKALWASVSAESEGTAPLLIKGLEFFHYAPAFHKGDGTSEKIRIEEAGQGFKKIRPAKGEGLIVTSEKGSPPGKTAELPSVGSTRINPVRYFAEIRMEKGFRPFWLVFNESFHKGWKASVNGVELKTHAEINGFANGWWIDGDFGEKFTVEISFTPQRRLDLGVKASLASAAVVLIGLALLNQRK